MLKGGRCERRRPLPACTGSLRKFLQVEGNRSIGIRGIERQMMEMGWRQFLPSGTGQGHPKQRCEQKAICPSDRPSGSPTIELR